MVEYFRFYYVSFFFRGKNGYYWLRVSVRSRFLSGANAVFDYSPWLAGYADAKTLWDRQRNTDSDGTMPWQSGEIKIMRIGCLHVE